MTEEKQENSEYGISTKQQKAIAALLSERTIGAAAKSAGVGERTLYTWLREDNFRAALRGAEKNLLDTVTRRLSAGLTLALDTLETLMQKARHESTRHAAAVSWLTLALKFKDLVNIDERLTALEAAIHEKHENKK